MFLSECKDYFKNIFQKRMVKHFRKCFKDMERYGEKGGKDICQKQIREKRR